MDVSSFFKMMTVKYILLSLFISSLCFAQEPSAPKDAAVVPAEETQKGLRFNYQNRFFLETDFKKPMLTSSFKVSSKATLDAESKKQKVVKRYADCSEDPMIPIDPEIYMLHYTGDMAVLKENLPLSSSKFKIRFQLNKEKLEALPDFKSKSKILKVFQVFQAEDCGLASKPLNTNFNPKTLELVATCTPPRCQVSRKPMLDKASQAELIFAVGFLEDDFLDAQEEAKAQKAEEALDQPQKKTGP